MDDEIKPADPVCAPDGVAYGPLTIVGGGALLFACMVCLMALMASIAEIVRGEFDRAPVAFALLETIIAVTSGWAWLSKVRQWRQLGGGMLESRRPVASD